MEFIKTTLEQIIHDLFDVPADFSVEVTPAPELESTNSFRADFATNVAMKLAGLLRKNPREVAKLITAKFDSSGISTEIAGPGFINFMLPDAYFTQNLTNLHTDFDKNISCNAYKNKNVVTEFSDPNPFKVLHIGHLYTSIMGESISRLIEYAGGTVHRVNFGGDVGLHVAKTLYALENKNLQDFTIEDIAAAYVEGTRAYDEDDSAKQAIVQLNKTIYDISAKDLHDSQLAQDYWRGRKLSYAYFDDFYARLGVHFEKYYPESSVASKGLQIVKEHPEVYPESDGALVFRGEDYGLHTRVFVNREGLPTYEAKDVGLLFTKNDDYHFDESVVITGNDIIDYMKVVLKSIEQYAPDLVAKTLHITHGNVRLPGNQKMSSRKGNFIKAVDILNEVEQKTGDKTLALAAIKYGLLKYRIGGNIEFDVEESISTTGNSGIYLLYSAVRANKILSSTSNSKPNLENYTLSSEEIILNKKFLTYRTVLEQAVREKAPHLIASYLFDLAQTFSRFYETCRVKGDQHEAERAVEVAVFAKTMAHGLNLLGINIPEEM
ncbi:MAG: arginine--tRNA ligase [Bacteroidaceae bacterium]|nr:arginine--tRNA ligase [Bacteroidaceae bacterium]MBR3595202.1 arginine--tRNA ligase [Candidatus Saccharibacteria bacterium]MBR6122711.1 arginine--tRNA ligase [Candidatus Saccharibacteria bacterium]